ncbi:MAG: hypothetical protein P8Y58_00240 [Novosphingobium sp.]
MPIAATGSPSDLSSMLRTSGLSADKIKVVQKNVDDIRKSASMPSSAVPPLDGAAFRKALDARIESDVAVGKLSQGDGAAVKQALGLNDAAAGESPADADGDSAAADAPVANAAKAYRQGADTYLSTIGPGTLFDVQA